MKYDKKNHLNLLKYSQKLEQEGKHLYDESREDFFKLREYSAMMISHLNWENRAHYFELIEELLNGPINFLHLRKKYQSVSDAVERLEAELILLDPMEPYDKAFGFTVLIDELVSLFDRYCPDPSIRESHELSEEELRDLVKDIFIEMKERYPENSKENL
jgi:hypothetical protein